MIFQELLHEERAEGKVEGKAEDILELLSELNEELPMSVKEKILSEKDLDVLKEYLKVAAKAKSMDDFMERIR